MLRFTETDGRLMAASGLFRVRAPVDHLWTIAGDIDKFPELIPMVHSVRHLPRTPAGDEVVRVQLKFRLAFFSVKFHFVGSFHTGPWRTEIRFIEGSVEDVSIHMEVAPVDAQTSMLRCHVGFDPRTLGWLVKAFLKHHPEIEGGVHPGSVMSIGMAAKEAAERTHASRR